MKKIKRVVNWYIEEVIIEEYANGDFEDWFICTILHIVTLSLLVAIALVIFNSWIHFTYQTISIGVILFLFIKNFGKIREWSEDEEE